MKVKETEISGCCEILPLVHQDHRGRFVKTFHQYNYLKYNFATAFAEEYYSISNKGVLRGLHFQYPPHDHTKIVYCISGEVMDVVVDLRVGSPTYGQYQSFNLNANDANIIYIPPGLAHGFYTLSEKAILMYKVTTAYSPNHDSGILWDSVGIPWPEKQPIVSQRDATFRPFSLFESPFPYGESNG